MVGGQVLIVMVGGAAFQVVRIGGRDWVRLLSQFSSASSHILSNLDSRMLPFIQAISILVGMLSLPIGLIVRLLPTEPFAQLLYKLHIYRDPSKLPVVSPAQEEVLWAQAITKTIVRPCFSLQPNASRLLLTIRSLPPERHEHLHRHPRRKVEELPRLQVPTSPSAQGRSRAHLPPRHDPILDRFVRRSCLETRRPVGSRWSQPEHLLDRSRFRQGPIFPP